MRPDQVQRPSRQGTIRRVSYMSAPSAIDVPCKDRQLAIRLERRLSNVDDGKEAVFGLSGGVDQDWRPCFLRTGIGEVARIVATGHQLRCMETYERSLIGIDMPHRSACAYRTVNLHDSPTARPRKEVPSMLSAQGSVGAGRAGAAKATEHRLRTARRVL